MAYTRLNPNYAARSGPTRMLNDKLEYRKVGSIVQVNLLGYNPGTISDTTTVATLPAGFRPGASAYLMADANYSSIGYIGSNGDVRVAGATSGKNIWACAVFPAWS